jgi:hypothetical protein
VVQEKNLFEDDYGLILCLTDLSIFFGHLEVPKMVCWSGGGRWQFSQLLIGVRLG